MLGARVFWAKPKSPARMPVLAGRVGIASRRSLRARHRLHVARIPGSAVVATALSATESQRSAAIIGRLRAQTHDFIHPVSEIGRGACSALARRRRNKLRWARGTTLPTISSRLLAPSLL